ncbi:MAG: radical SAM domain-containing protein, partial [Deltaproteobacteria bacterium]|nr:radical SAM domain-containing protein [Deltaproteobacteria bacterium]
SRGCLYKCRFCKVKNSTPFAELRRAEITNQLNQLKLIVNKDLANYNSIFLGEHDALGVNYKLILHAVEESSDKLQLHRSKILGSNTFFFGSVGSLLNAPAKLFRELGRLPGNTFINIGLESADQATLDHLGKPIQESNVRDAFQRIQEINQKFGTVEITSNFIMDENLPSGHYPKILELIRDSQQHKKPKGAVYFSPLTFGQPSRSKLFEFNRLKLLSRLPTYLYTIQRL